MSHVNESPHVLLNELQKVTANYHGIEDTDPAQAFIADREPYWTEFSWREGKEATVISCGDDRTMLARSMDELDAQQDDTTLPLHEGYARIFGGVIGLSKNLLLAGSATHGARFIADMNGMRGAIRTVVASLGQRGVIHTDTGNELNGSFHANVPKARGVGCAYAMKTGESSDLLVTDPIVSRQGYEEQISFFGNNAEASTEALFGSHQLFQSYCRSVAGNTPYAIGRGQFAAMNSEHGVPVAVLQGNHLPAPDTAVIGNFHLDRVSNPTAANQARQGFYGSDIAVATAALGHVLQRHHIAPVLYMQSLVLDAAPVRALLSKTPDSAYNPQALPLYTVGEPLAAAEELNTLYGD